MTTDNLRCRKRNGDVVPFDPAKIRRALTLCFGNVRPDVTGDELAWTVADLSNRTVNALRASGQHLPGVEDVQRLVIQQLWVQGHFEAAEHYQNYREQHRKKRLLETAAVFEPRVAFKPFQYPDAVQFKEAIQKSFWTVKDFDPISDVQSFLVQLSRAERNACAHTLLAISQIEVSVKRFWTNLGARLPKAEFEQVGVVFGDSEVRHADAYSRALDVLGLDHAFKTVATVPAIKGRIDYLNKSMKAGLTGTDQGFAKTLAVFALLVENVSLFSQFVIMRSFYQHSGAMKNIDNIVQATMKEELVHATFGAWLCNLIRSERPEWFSPAFRDELRTACLDAFAAEGRILDWILADGHAPGVSRPVLDDFLRDRINQGVVMIGCDPVFPDVTGPPAELDWFTKELAVPLQVDFFWKRPTNYTGNDVEVSADTMW